MIVEDREDHLGAVDHPEVEIVFNVAGLDGTELFIYDQHVRTGLAHFAGDLIQPAFAKITGAFGVVAFLGVGAQNLDPGCVGQAL